MTIEAVLTDLVRDDWYAGGWYSTGCNTIHRRIEIPSGASEATIARRIKKDLGITGWRRDTWTGGDYCWRRGKVGAYADITRL